ncbi:MAG: hypothetical protein ACE37H_13830 [Phycisphaeraceae bacterium]
MAQSDDQPDFSGKVVMFAIGGGTAVATYAIDNPRFEMQAGRLFVTGTQVYGSTADDWAGPVSTAVAWDAVEGYIVFDSAEQYQRGASRAQPKPKSFRLFGG